MDTKAINTDTLPLRILTVGLRQFRRPDTNHPTWVKPWDWHTMQKLPGLHPERTQTAWDRLHSVDINITTAVDLLPPGGDFLAEEAERAAAYLRGVVEGLNEADLQTGSNLGYDIVALLGGRVADAFCASDKRLHDMRLLSLRDMGSYGVVILPSPHTVETTGEGWWSAAEKQQALRDAVAGW
mgnify:FL=1